nr:hypothetical protein [Tanacetum cinerariifolium]
AKVKGLCRGSGGGSWGSSRVWWSGAEVKEMDWAKVKGLCRGSGGGS